LGSPDRSPGSGPEPWPALPGELGPADEVARELLPRRQAIETTQIYLHADLTIKERALARTQPTGTPPGRYRAPDTLLAFLESL